VSIRTRLSTRRERRDEARRAKRARLQRGTKLRPSSGWATIVQALAFVRKELAEIVRQPMLLLLLVLGPFILLLLFGAGYKDTTIKLRTEFVGPEGSLYEDAISDYSDQLDEYIEVRGFTADEQAARRDLEQGRLDAVVVFPPDALDQILSGQSAKITVLHDTIDPFQQVAIDVSSRLAVQEVNASVLGSIAAETQDAMAPVTQTASVLTEQAATLTQAAEGGDAATIAQAAGTVAATVADARVVVATSQQVIEQLDGTEDSPAISELLASLESAEAEANAISADGGATTAEQAAQLGATLPAVAETMASATAVDPAVLVRPFEAATENIAPVTVEPPDYFTPAAIVLLLQHLAITFAALSLVRDREHGLFELLRVGPLSSTEILIGKTIAYLTVGLTVGAVLIAAAVYVLRIPLEGEVWWVAATVALVLLASLALGMVLSMISGSETQAVQYAMLTLLAGLFFSGFVLDISQLATPYRYISYLLPVTYGIDMLHDVMLRGVAPQSSDLIGLGALTGAYGVLAVALLHRRLRTA